MAMATFPQDAGVSAAVASLDAVSLFPSAEVAAAQLLPPHPCACSRCSRHTHLRRPAT